MFSHIQSSGYEKSRVSNKKPQRLWTCLYSLVLLSICVSCHEFSVSEKSNTANCNPQFFQEFGRIDSSISSTYFKTDSIVYINDSLCGYWHQFGFWMIPVDIHQGVLYMDDNSIFLIPQHDSLGYKLFDFNMSVGSHIPINYVLIYPINEDSRNEVFQDTKAYDLVLEEMFWDTTLSDRLFKFRFRNYLPIDMSEDLVFWVGKEIGVIGMYITSALPENQKSELIRFYIGDIYLERIDTSKVETDGSDFDFL